MIITFPGADVEETRGLVFVMTRECRPPKKGEFFLSGAIPEVYQATNDLDTAYDIMRRAPQPPVINNNGETFASHKAKLKTFVRVAREAKAALQEMSPHPRDFQTAPRGTFERADAEFRAHLRSLQRIEDDYYAIWMQLEEKELERRQHTGKA